MANDYKNNMLDSLRNEMLDIVGQELTPKARRYGYSDVSLESFISWKPIVLILGNYSSGKSTLINELIGQKIQSTGQAPTDDSFTVITGQTFSHKDDGHVETRDGKAILNDPEFPFEKLKRHGERFSAHFKMKRVESDLLDNLAIIDTPGMLDSISEQDRGYDYQRVIADFASIADLILVLFDPHKAGTVRESHESLRDTLPSATFEDRVVFVLNRVDECGCLDDLLRVYGTLCWNLSQMTGRKDIPRILLSYAQNEQVGSHAQGYLELLNNQRNQLVEVIKSAPKARLDNMASFMESHSLKLKWLIRGLLEYRKSTRSFLSVSGFIGAIFSVFFGGAAAVYSYFVEPWGPLTDLQNTSIALCSFVLLYLIWLIALFKLFLPAKQKVLAMDIDDLVITQNQHEKELWQSVKPFVLKRITSGRPIPQIGILSRDLKGLESLLRLKSSELRKAIGDVVAGKYDDKKQVLISDE